MGTGKSALGRVAALALGRPFADTDAVVEARAGHSVPELFARWGEARFRALEAEVVRALSPAAAAVLATGGGTLGDPANVAALRAGGLLVALMAPAEVILRRVGGAGAAQTRPLLAGADPLARIRALLAERAALYRQADLTLDVGGEGGIDAALAALLARLASAPPPAPDADR